MSEFLESYGVYIMVPLVLIVLGLSIYLGVLWKQIKVQKAELLKKAIEKRDFVEDSLRTIALATIQGQCDLSECVHRTKNLLDMLPDMKDEKDYEVIYNMYEEIKVFPTHQRRLDQTKQEIFKQDSHRFRIEDKYRDRLIKSLEILHKSLSA